MEHFNKILLILCLSCLTSGHLNHFVQLTPVEPNEHSIEVSGVINTAESFNNTVEGEIRVKTRYPVKVVYCDSYSDIAIGKIVREKEEEHIKDVRRFIFTIPANVAVLNTILGSAGLRCTVYVNNTLRHFSLIYGTNGGVKLLTNSSDTELNILKTVYEDAPHLWWLLVVMIVVVLCILVIVPTALVISNRKTVV